MLTGMVETPQPDLDVAVHRSSSSAATTVLLAAAVIGGAVAISLGAYGRIHGPTGEQIVSFGFPTTLSMKAWLATGAAALAVVQTASAAWMWRWLPGAGEAPTWIPSFHRWLGTAAFVLTLPVAYHCLWSLGFQTTTTRVLTHSLLGCFFYGAMATKLLALRIDGMPRRALPLIGASLTLALTGLWLTSSLWFFTNVGFPGI